MARDILALWPGTWIVFKDGGPWGTLVLYQSTKRRASPAAILRARCTSTPELFERSGLAREMCRRRIWRPPGRREDAPVAAWGHDWTEKRLNPNAIGMPSALSWQSGCSSDEAALAPHLQSLRAFSMVTWNRTEMLAQAPLPTTGFSLACLPPF